MPCPSYSCSNLRGFLSSSQSSCHTPVSRNFPWTGAGTLFVSHSKSGKARQVYLDPEVIQFFTAVCDKRRRKDFIFADGGKRWKKDSAKGLMEAACKAAEIARLTFHELRHSAADVRMTQRYAHLCQQTLANKIRQMPAMGIYAIVPQPKPRSEPKPQTDKIQ